MTDDEILAAFVAASERERWCPHAPTPQQATFLGLDCLEALYGGAAGGGKSDALLMAALMHVDHPNYAALLLRKTYADLSLPGAIMDRAGAWLRGTAATWRDTDKTWTFPSGARLTFGYLETEADKYRYQSAEFQFVGFDELTQFTETQYRYLLSRLRRLSGSSVPLRQRGATNPGGIGHTWVKTRFRPEIARGKPIATEGRVFVPAKLSDNPHVDQASYGEALERLDETTRRQLRDGEWVQDAQGLVYHFAAERNEAPSLPARKDWRYIWCADYGASQRNATTAIGVVAYSPYVAEVYLAECSKHAGMIPSTMAERFKADRLVYGGFVRVLGDQGGLGGGYNQELRERHAIPIENVEKQNKLGYRKLLNGDLERGAFRVVGPRCQDWIDEAQNLLWNDRGTDCATGQPDHATDMALYAWREAKHFLSEEERKEPANNGSRERAEWEAKRMLEAEKERASLAPSPFWDRR